MNLPLRTICYHPTPSPLAAAVVGALGDEPELAWLEPCVGAGVFLRELRDLEVETHRVAGVELATEAFGFTDYGKIVRGTDFLHWSKSIPPCFDRIVCNPPYINISKLPSPLMQNALEVPGIDGEPMRKRANSWYAFVCATVRLLKQNGAMAFILPASFEFADYARPLREGIHEFFRRVEIYRCRVPLFSDVTEGCVVLLCFGRGEGPGQVYRRVFDTSDELVSELRNPLDKPFCESSSSHAPDESVFLSQLLDIRIGAVTGDAKYFLLCDSTRRELDLPQEAMIPVLTKSRHLLGGEITKSDWEKLRKADERVWLFRPDAELLQERAVALYLERGEQGGICRQDAYKIRNRINWYQTPLPPPCDGFFTGMSKRLRWPCINRMRNLSATNTLYTFRFRQQFSLEEKYAWALSILKAQEASFGESRTYADGLKKWEPGDLYKLRVRRPATVEGARETFLSAAELLRRGG